MRNWKKLKRTILENNVNVQKEHLEVFYEKNRSSKFCNVYRKALVFRCFPANIAKILKNLF